LEKLKKEENGSKRQWNLIATYKILNGRSRKNEDDIGIKPNK